MKNLIKVTFFFFTFQTIIFHSCKKEEVPTLSTTTISNITATSASSGGIIASDGGARVTTRGVCWSINTNPTTSDSKTVDGDGDGQFSSNLTGLNAGSTYHVRAYATNSVGTGYGADLSFATLGKAPECITQPATNISSSGATLNGTINANFLSTTVTFEYGTTTSYQQTITSAQSPVTGNNITNVSADISGLTPGTNYHYRVASVNSIGTTNGNDLTFTTASIIPTITTTTISNRTTNSAMTGGNITSDGGASITARGVCWAITLNPTITDSKTSNGTGTGSFTSKITGLTPGTSYHVRAYATNSIGTSYGGDSTFTTLADVPLVTTSAVTVVTQTSAISGGNVSSDGGSSVTARGVCWDTNPNPTIAGFHTSNGTGTGTFSSNITELTPGGTLYYIRAYAANSSGTSYGNELTFTTLPIVPTVTTTLATSVTTTTAATGGNVTSDGGTPVTEKGVCWSTAPNPTFAGLRTSDGTGNGAFISNLIGLNPNTVYYVRAYAVNSVGIAYGNFIAFTTNPVVLATLTTNSVTSVTETAAVSGGNITDDGGAFIIERGVCWSVNINPTVIDDKTIDGIGIGSFVSNLTGLRCGITYYVRAYATNSVGTAYGSQQSFTTKMIPTVFNPNLTYGSVSDIDGNSYKTIQIGTQTWMAENLRTTKYNDGIIIPNVTDNIGWHDLITGAYCWFNNDGTTYKTTYGALYNWYAVNTGKLCPTGWHVPSDGEWTILSTYLGGADVAGGKMKETGTIHWASPNTGATNESGFTGLPGGQRDYSLSHAFWNIGEMAFWWTSTMEPPSNPYAEPTIHYRGLVSNSIFVDVSLTQYIIQSGLSIRCMKD